MVTVVTALAGDAAETTRRIEAVYRPSRALDLLRTVGFHRRGLPDPTLVIDQGMIWRASLEASGVATIALRQRRDGTVEAAAWGPGRDSAMAHVPALCGADDDDAGFDASRHPVIAASAHRNPGLRLSRTGSFFDVLASAVLEQKVTAVQAFAAWRRLVTALGTRAPGPTPRAMFAAPPAAQWRRIPSWTWHRTGVEPAQSQTIVRAAAREPSLSHAVMTALDSTARHTTMTSVAGIGPWTAAEVAIRALGDADAVSVGDFHLAHQVGFALTGSRTDDAGMLELLAEWPGHRQRVIRLIAASGVREERRAPRLHPEDHRRR